MMGGVLFVGVLLWVRTSSSPLGFEAHVEQRIAGCVQEWSWADSFLPDKKIVKDTRDIVSQLAGLSLGQMDEIDKPDKFIPNAEKLLAKVMLIMSMTKLSIRMMMMW
jgi:hypothetical protein